MEKAISPAIVQKRKIKKLSEKSSEESLAIGKRNTAIFREKFADADSLVVTKLAEGTSPSSISDSPDISSPRMLNKRLKIPKIPTKLEEDDDYDEGGFTPRPRPVSTSQINQCVPLPNISNSVPTGLRRENSVFITTPGSGLY